MPKLRIVLSCNITEKQYKDIQKYGTALGKVPTFKFSFRRDNGKGKIETLKFEVTEAYVSEY